MTIDEYIADKIRKRFNLPADADVWSDIDPVEPETIYGMQIAGSYEIDVGDYVSPYPNSAGRKPKSLATYAGWDEFVADMEVTENEEKAI